MNRENSLTPSNQTLETLRDPSEQERIKTQMEQILLRLGVIGQLISHPAFSKYASLNDDEGNVYWHFGLTRNDGIPEMTTNDDIGKNDVVSISNQKDHAGIYIYLDSPHFNANFTKEEWQAAEEKYDDFLENPILPDPITGEALTHIDIHYNTKAQEGGFLAWLLHLDRPTFKHLAVEAKIMRNAHEFVSNYPGVIFPRVSKRYRNEYFARPQIDKRSIQVFEEYTLERKDDPDYNNMGFPYSQDFPMTDDECLKRVDTLVNFMVPILQKEIDSYNAQLPETTRRLGSDRKLLTN